ncbi:hypothetical protein [Kitasatospora sp. NPDC051914]|uniref:hypothetical protein n=1 Tax=Kitasatospora sp. NPDC051914 TaxID=3154945 RepID=UPI00342451E2
MPTARPGRRSAALTASAAPASSADGKALFGLGPDMGGMALCYRSDLFKAAGLPTERGQVSALLTDRPACTAAGKRFLANSPDKNVKWFDRAAPSSGSACCCPTSPRSPRSP